jgi:glutaredoxin
MKVIASRRILFCWAAATALLALPAHAQLDDLFRAPGTAPETTQGTLGAKPKPARPTQAPSTAAQKPTPAAAPGTAAAEKGHKDKVVIYTTPTCPHCIRALRHMNDRQIAYIQKDVQHDQANRAEFKQIGGRGVPHILMGETVMVGFSPQNFDQNYGAWKAGSGNAR